MLKSAHLLMGGCGDTRAMHEAGYEVVGGINHLEICVDTARANWPNARWFQHDVTQFPMELLPAADVIVGGIICTELSRNGGRRTTQRHPSQEAIPTAADAIEDSRFKMTRATAWCVARAAEILRPKILITENVPDFVTRWLPNKHWRGAIECFNYHPAQIVSVNAAFVSGPNNQVAPATRDRTFTVFVHKDLRVPDLNHRPLAWCPRCDEDVLAKQAWSTPVHAGEYRDQYWYVCGAEGCGQRVEPYAGAASAAFDLTDIGERVGGPRIRGRKLAPATVGRAEKAIDFLQDPRRYRRRIPGGNHLTDIDGRYHAVVEMRRNCNAASIHEPLSTVTAQGRHHCLVTAPEGWKPGMPMEVNDLHLRSIYPPEQVRALRFPDEHIMAARTDKELGLLAGNAIPVNVGHWLGAQVREVLS